MADDITTDYRKADTYFVSSSSMVERGNVRDAKKAGKKIVLRVDNALRNSRNRNTGMTRMLDFYDWADLVIYQSNWARSFLEPYLQQHGQRPSVIILNGADTTKFNSYHRKLYPERYLYVRSSRDEGKQWVMAWYWFVNNPGVLEIAGQFSPDNIEYNFDFFNNEKFNFTGMHNDMAEVYKRNKYFLYTYTNDACSNTLIEAKLSGCEIIDVYNSLQTGGAPEIMACEDLSLERMVKEYREAIYSI